MGAVLKSEKRITVGTLALGLMFLLTALTGLVSQNLLSLGLVVCMVFLLLEDKLYLAFPFMIFYNNFYGLFLGLSVWRIFTLLLFLSLILHQKKKWSFSPIYLIPVFIYGAFLLLGMKEVSMQSVIFLFVDVIACLLMVFTFQDDREKTENCFKVYVVVALLSFLTGVICQNTIGSEYTFTRFNATFEDPNYMGFFFTVAVFSLVTLKLFRPFVRYLLVIVLYAMVLTTLSVSAILVNVLTWIVYLFFAKKIKPSVFVVALLVFVVLMGLYSYGAENPDAPVIGEFAGRIEEKLEELETGDINAVTTGRTDVMKQNLDYFFGRSVMGLLFGGVPVNTRYVHPDLRYVSHNEYVDMLINVGFIGAIAMFVFFFSRFSGHVYKYRKSGEGKELFFVMGKIIWMFYAVTLTMFLDFRFTLLFLI